VANYRVKISSTAEKALKKIPKKQISKIIEVIQMLAIQPYPKGCRKLSGEETIFRVRHGNYRIIYEVIDNELIILVLKIGHRKDIYRK
jgi:mRNA interferase RelE/StbE